MNGFQCFTLLVRSWIIGRRGARAHTRVRGTHIVRRKVRGFLTGIVIAATYGRAQSDKVAFELSDGRVVNEYRGVQIEVQLLTISPSDRQGQQRVHALIRKNDIVGEIVYG